MTTDTDSALHQIGTLPIRRGANGRVQVLLVTSRETRRWTIPKGWPMKRLKDHRAAAQEALEEAGVEGRIQKEPIGSYLYWKRRERHFDLCRVTVYVMEVTRELEDWQEADERTRRWFELEEAELLIAEPQLISLVMSLV